MKMKVVKWVENTVEKGEMLVKRNFSFFHSIFKRLILQTHKQSERFWDRVKTEFIYSMHKKKSPHLSISSSATDM